MLLKLSSTCVVFFLIVLVNFINCDPIPYKDCGMFFLFRFLAHLDKINFYFISGSKGVTVNLFDISDCSTFPCIFHKNSTITLKLNFTTSNLVLFESNFFRFILTNPKY